MQGGALHIYNANSRIDNLCLQQTNLVCNFGRQGLSAFRTLSRTSLDKPCLQICLQICLRFSQAQGAERGRSKARKDGAIMQTKFV